MMPMSPAPETGDAPATMQTGAIIAVAMAATTANRRPAVAAAAIPATAGIEAQVAAACT